MANPQCSRVGITDALTTGRMQILDNDFITTGKACANMFTNTSNLPNATTYHGMFAHVHTTGAGYFAHGGSWVRLANHSELFSGSSSSALLAACRCWSGQQVVDAAPLASPALTGTPTAPTATYNTNTTQIATTAFVQSIRIWFGGKCICICFCSKSPSAEIYGLIK